MMMLAFLTLQHAKPRWRRGNYRRTTRRQRSMACRGRRRRKDAQAARACLYRIFRTCGRRSRRQRETLSAGAGLCAKKRVRERRFWRRDHPRQSALDVTAVLAEEASREDVRRHDGREPAHRFPLAVSAGRRAPWKAAEVSSRHARICRMSISQGLLLALECHTVHGDSLWNRSRERTRTRLRSIRSGRYEGNPAQLLIEEEDNAAQRGFYRTAKASDPGQCALNSLESVNRGRTAQETR